jgi:hypothetical protein
MRMFGDDLGSDVYEASLWGQAGRLLRMS